MQIQAISGINFRSNNRTNSVSMPRVSKNQMKDTVSFGVLEKKLLKVGTSYLLTIDKTLLGLMDVMPTDKSLKIALNDKKLFISKSLDNGLDAHVAMRKSGTSTVITMPKVIMDLLGINPEKSMVKLDFNDGKLIMSKGSSISEKAPKSEVK